MKIVSLFLAQLAALLLAACSSPDNQPHGLILPFVSRTVKPHGAPAAGVTATLDIGPSYARGGFVVQPSLSATFVSGPRGAQTGSFEGRFYCLRPDVVTPFVFAGVGITITESNEELAKALAGAGLQWRGWFADGTIESTGFGYVRFGRVIEWK